MSRTLRRKYYARKLEGLRHSDPRTWWRTVKLITGQSVNTTQPLIGLANQLYDGNVHALADSVNRIFNSRVWPRTSAHWTTAVCRPRQTLFLMN